MSQPVLVSASLGGERVSLRPLTPEDIDAAYPMMADRHEILRWLIWDGPSSLEEMRRLYRWTNVETPDGRANGAGEAAGRDYRFAILDEEKQALVGCIGVRFAGHPHSGDVGYWIGEEFWGRGYATEAVRLLSFLCFEHLDASTLFAHVFVGNLASRVVLEKNGFVFTHLSRGKVVKWGEPIDEWYLALTREGFRGEHGAWRPQALAVTLE